MKVRLNNNQPTSAQKRALRQECVREFDILLENSNIDIRLQLLHYFRFKKGYGQKRLEELDSDLREMLKTIHARYELSEGDTAWLCKKRLEDSGINLDAIFKEEG